MFKKESDNYQKLSMYIQLLLECQNYFNLISKKSINSLWSRHINDSLQLKNYINITNGDILDLGTGAGFPGMVLAICDIKNNYFLIDSNTKKTTFLNIVKNKLNLTHVTIINNRIENLYPHFKADIIVSRALTKLDNLLVYTLNLLKPIGKAIFLKGESLQEEINNTNKNLLNLFSFEIFNNKINNNGKIITFSMKKFMNINDFKNEQY